MSNERFIRFQKSIDDELLEEAGSYTKKKTNIRLIVTMAACFCAVLAGVMAWRPWDKGSNATMNSSAVYSMDTAAAGSFAEAPAAPEAASAPEAFSIMADEDYETPEMEEATEDMGTEEAAKRNDLLTGAASMANPIHECTLKELAELGYEFVLPTGAEVTFTAYIDGMDAPLGEVRFTKAGEEYTWRALKTSAQEDISGVYDADAAENTWVSGSGLPVTLRKGTEGTLLLWYSAEKEMQWCLWGRDAEPDDVLELAEGMVSGEGGSVYMPAS